MSVDGTPSRTAVKELPALKLVFLVKLGLDGSKLDRQRISLPISGRGRRARLGRAPGKSTTRTSSETCVVAILGSISV